MCKGKLKGQKFGKLLVIEETYRAKDGRVLWKCLCDCGKETKVPTGSLRSGNSTSCGCGRIESITKHGYSKRGKVHPLFKVWTTMLQRCGNPKAQRYEDYGNRGIKVCERWKEFIHFYKDMIPTYKPGLSIDRMDNDGNYEPSNCRWATRSQQQSNKRNSKLLSG